MRCVGGLTRLGGGRAGAGSPPYPYFFCAFLWPINNKSNPQITAKIFFQFLIISGKNAAQSAKM
jgi:hypothetical protein